MTMKQATAFFSLILWPDNVDRLDVVDRLSDATGVDVHTLRLRLAADAPNVVAPLPAPRADAGVETIRSLGGEAFAPKMEELVRLGPSLKIRALSMAEGILHAEIWRGPSTVIDPAHIEFLVLGRLRDERDFDPIADAPTPSILAPGAAVKAALVAGSQGPLTFNGGLLSAGLLAGDELLSATASARPTVLPNVKMDIHMKSGSIFQIDGAKHSFDLLGELKGPSDEINIRKMIGLFESMNERIVTDGHYAMFRPPPQHTRLRLPGLAVDRDTSPFPFYSRWAALMYRCLLRPS